MTQWQSLNKKNARILFGLLVIFCSVLGLNGAYLAIVNFLEWALLREIQGVTYQYLFAIHLVFGCLLPVIVLGYFLSHHNSIRDIKNKRAIKRGYFILGILGGVFITGLLLTQGISGLEIKRPLLRNSLYWLHLGLPVVAFIYYWKHRKSGRSRSRRLVHYSIFPLVLTLSFGPLLMESQVTETGGNGLSKKKSDFSPSLIKTANNNYITDKILTRDEYCKDCHPGSHERWKKSAHRLSSFNNPFYRFSVENTRKASLAKEGNVHASRFCAGCHDPVPLLSGAFDNPDFNQNSPSASVGITCTVCHAVNSINSPKGNSDFTIKAPEHYPFAFSDSALLRWFSGILLKSNPDFHKRTFLKPLHQSPEFCGACHKVHIPIELNGYRWLRGQNHYDSFWLSGVSGNSVMSFYYPAKALTSCKACHMPPYPTSEFGAKSIDKMGSSLYGSDHLFPGANTALPFELIKTPDPVITEHQKMLKGAARIDIIGLRRSGRIDGEFIGPIGSKLPNLVAGEEYLIEVVIRTLRIGHALTQGTVDSNQIWLQLEVENDEGSTLGNGRLEAKSGRLEIDTHKVNAYVIDRKGQRISKRDVENIYTKLYDHQIPPGAADVVHYRLKIKNGYSGAIRIRAKLLYRKFDNDFYRLVKAEERDVNPLPVTMMAEDTVNLPVGITMPDAIPESVPLWERMNDYGIGLFRKPDHAQFRQAEEVFNWVAQQGHQEGTLNLVRLYYGEGRLEEAMASINQLDVSSISNPWTVTWFAALISRDEGLLDQAISKMETLLSSDLPWIKERGFNFSNDYRLLNALAETLVYRSKLEKSGSITRTSYLQKAQNFYQKVLDLEPENSEAYFGLFTVYTMLGNPQKAEHYQAMHRYYKEDDLAKEIAIGLARERDPEADRAANAVVIYELHDDKRFDQHANIIN